MIDHSPTPASQDPTLHNHNPAFHSEYVAATPYGDLSVSLAQQSTRVDSPEDFYLQGHAFDRDTIDWSRVTDHIRIHHGGEVAGSQFNADLLASPEEVVAFAGSILPESIQYDQADRAELTFEVGLPEGAFVGFTGVKSLAELSEVEGATIEKKMRIPGGEPDIVEGISGAWFPERAKNSTTGAFEVTVNPDGSAKNPRGQFVPESLIATIPSAEGLKTNKVTVIIQKDPQDKPCVLTLFPGDNAPAGPVLIDSEHYKQNTLHADGPNAFWQSHAFVTVNSQ